MSARLHCGAAWATKSRSPCSQKRPSSSRLPSGCEKDGNALPPVQQYVPFKIDKGWTSNIVQMHARVVTLHLCRTQRPEVQQT